MTTVALTILIPLSLLLIVFGIFYIVRPR